MKKALITGITGQDGSYLAELLLYLNYEVHGIIRRSSCFNTSRIDHLMNKDFFYLYHGDLTDSSCLSKLINKIEPDEIYNLGAQSHVAVSFQMPEYTVDTIVKGTLSLLESTRAFEEKIGKKVKFYQASSSEMFGKVVEIPQKETTPFYPRSPYACAKVYAYHQCINYRESYNMFISNGILFNHESPRRGETFVTKKIVNGLIDIKKKKKKKLYLGNLNSKRDWGFAPEYVNAMYMMLQQEYPDDFVIATGEVHTVKEFLDCCLEKLELDYSCVEYNIPSYMRPAEVDILVGDNTKAREKLGWIPKVKFKHLIDIMISSELKRL